MTLHTLLNERFGAKEEKKAKMAALTQKSQNLAVVLQTEELTPVEKEKLAFLLQRFATEECDPGGDLFTLSSLTSEVKTISNQAALLHGERIKRAQELLGKYKEGAFTAWLMHTYGNRQTPYNFFQYYEFSLLVPKELHPIIHAMPRQAVYVLASRKGPFEQKEEIIRSATGKTKDELLSHIREVFPVSETDKRKSVASFQVLMNQLKKIEKQLGSTALKEGQKQALRNLLGSLQKILSP